jgi:hypothetical protein
VRAAHQEAEARVAAAASDSSSRRRGLEVLGRGGLQRGHHGDPLDPVPGPAEDGQRARRPRGVDERHADVATPDRGRRAITSRGVDQRLATRKTRLPSTIPAPQAERGARAGVAGSEGLARVDDLDRDDEREEHERDGLTRRAAA